MNIVNTAFRIKFLCASSAPIDKKDIIEHIKHYKHVINQYALFELNKAIKVGKYDWTIKIKEINANRHLLDVYDQHGRLALTGFLYFLIK